mmetsp:Transcript_10898/g.28601  ORF Transcript_10898/g.28601 Transcript_10898/m.28601 type:complete len:417 (+) Transcript_10898:1315-2565(+)
MLVARAMARATAERDFFSPPCFSPPLPPSEWRGREGESGEGKMGVGRCLSSFFCFSLSPAIPILLPPPLALLSSCLPSATLSFFFFLLFADTAFPFTFVFAFPAFFSSTFSCLSTLSFPSTSPSPSPSFSASPSSCSLPLLSSSSFSFSSSSSSLSDRSAAPLSTLPSTGRGEDSTASAFTLVSFSSSASTFSSSFSSSSTFSSSLSFSCWRGSMCSAPPISSSSSRCCTAEIREGRCSPLLSLPSSSTLTAAVSTSPPPISAISSLSTSSSSSSSSPPFFFTLPFFFTFFFTFPFPTFFTFFVLPAFFFPPSLPLPTFDTPPPSPFSSLTLSFGGEGSSADTTGMRTADMPGVPPIEVGDEMREDADVPNSIPSPLSPPFSFITNVSDSFLILLDCLLIFSQCASFFLLSIATCK